MKRKLTSSHIRSRTISTLKVPNAEAGKVQVESSRKNDEEEECVCGAKAINTVKI